MEDKFIEIDPYGEENWNEVEQDIDDDINAPRYWKHGPKFTSFIEERRADGYYAVGCSGTSGSSGTKHVIKNGRFTHKKYDIIDNYKRKHKNEKRVGIR